MKKLFLILFFLLCACLCFAQNGRLVGKVVDVVTNESLAGAHVRIETLNKVAVSDSEGKFVIILPFDTEIVLQTTFIGYSTVESKICLSRDANITINMEPDNTLADIYVYGARRDFGVRSTQMSAVAVPIERIETMPALFGEIDVMKVLQKLPGVQSQGEGMSGIVVRGGNYDQNLITLDGSTLYNSEHLKGFVSAINADMVNNLLLYKGAFPARYGARLSSVVDIGIKEGDFQKIRGSVGIGMLSSKIQLEGPIFRGKTSFNIGARVSYFDAIVMPLLEKVYDKPDNLQPYANMNFYDISAKLVHKFSDKDKLSAVFYWGKDVNDSAPTVSRQTYSSETVSVNNMRSSRAENNWGNMVSSLFYTHKTDNDLSINTNLSFSRYDYMLKIATEIEETSTSFNATDILDKYRENSYVVHNSDINDLALSADFLLSKAKHDLRWGTKVSLQRFGPVVDVFKDSYTYKQTETVGEKIEMSQYIDTLLGCNHNMQTFALYAEDDFELGKKWRANLGFRYTLYAVKNKSYHSLEPRVSLRYLINNNLSLKGSYSRMAQGLHLLNSSNLVMPSDLWVPVTENIPLMTSNQLALGCNWNIINGVDFSVEGYYKTIDNVLEYEEGASYTKANGDWQRQVVLGEGWSYGAELLIEKNIGKSTGWIGYTWSKSLRKFDSYGNVINGGDKFYANNDRRHNFNIVFAHTFNSHWKISGSWTYQSGRRGTLATTSIYGATPDEYDAFGNPLLSEIYGRGEVLSSAPEKIIHLDKFLRYYTYRQRNGFILPAVHRLDVGVTYTTGTSIGDLELSLDICNLYNRKNISNVYIGYHNNQTVLKGICLLPFMPSVNIVLKF